MATPAPDGTISLGPVTITKADFVLDMGSGKYYLDLRFTDTNYRRTTKQAYLSYCAASDKDISFSPQSPFQIPSYVVRILKKTTPSSQSTGYTTIQSLYNDFSSFNDQTYYDTSLNTFSAKGFGLGIVPYYYSFSSCPYTYSSITEFDATSSGGVVEVQLDGSGGANYLSGPQAGSAPLKQATFGGFYQTGTAPPARDPPTWVALIDGDDFQYSQEQDSYVYYSPPTGIANLQGWFIDDQFSDPNAVPANKVYLQFKAAAAQVAKYIDIGQTASLKLRSGPTPGYPPSNNATFTVHKTSNTSCTATLVPDVFIPTPFTASYVFDPPIPKETVPEGNGPVTLACSSFNIASNGFSEPGAYLVLVTRNAIQTKRSANILNAKVDFDLSSPSCVGALAIIDLPVPTLAFSPSDNLYSVAFDSYGSVDISNNKWQIAGLNDSLPNFISERYPYDTFPSRFLTRIPANTNDALNTITTTANVLTLQQIEHTPFAFDLSSAFTYDFEISHAPTKSLIPYSQTSSYVNFSTANSAIWNNSSMTPSFSNDVGTTWSSLIEANPVTDSTILNYSSNSSQTVYTNTLSVPSSSSLIPFSTEIVEIGGEYLFHSQWQDTFYNFLTPYVVDSSFVLRLYQKDPLSAKSVEETYADGPIENYKYVSPTETGLEVLPNWKVAPPTAKMDIYTDKLGNIFYNSPPGSGYTGWSTDEISGAWLMILQRNFTTSPTSDISEVTILNEACYAVNVNDPSLALVKNVDNEPIGLDTFNTITYADASNLWNVFELEGGNVISLPDLISEPDPTIGEFEDAYPLRDGPGLATNRIVNKFDAGVHFPEQLGVYGLHITTDASGVSQTNYDVSTNSVLIYEPTQSNNPNEYFSFFRYIPDTYDISNARFQLQIVDPSYSELRDLAYDINIFRKERGIGTLTSQWYPSGEYEPYVYTNITDRGITLLKNDIINGSSFSPPPVSGQDGRLITIDSCGNTTLSLTPLDMSGSFEAGGYFVTVRRNFSKGTVAHPNAKEPYFTLNTQYIYVRPTEQWFNELLVSSPDISLVQNVPNPGFSKLETETPVYGSWNSVGTTPDISINWFVNFEGFSIPSYTVVSPQSGIITLTNSGGFMDISGIEINYAGLGTLNTYAAYTYNWEAPTDISLAIGNVGNGFATIEPADTFLAPTRVAPNAISLEQNQVITGVYNYLLPDDVSWNAANIVNDLRASFIIPAGTTDRLMSLSWKDPSPLDLCANWTGFPYAIRLYKKEALGYSANDQWYSQDNSGIYPYQFREPNYQGVGISAEFFSDSPTGDTMYIFLDLSGGIFYNGFPTSPAPVVTPFTDGGGYIVVVQRHYTDSNGDFALSTIGHYLNFIPTGPDNPWSLEEQGNLIISNPNPYSSYEPGVEGGNQNLKFVWDMSIPERGFKKKVPAQDTSAIDIDVILRAYSGYGTGNLTSEVTYDFSLYGDGSKVTTKPFIEHYPVLSILGEPFPIYFSNPYEVDLCRRPGSYPPPPWVRFTNSCSNSGYTSEQLQMRRKAETLRHETTLKAKRFTKAEYYAFVAKGFNNKKKTYATQTDTFTNPNTQNYPSNGDGLTLPSSCPNQILTFPSSASDVPGPVVPLTYDPNVPLVRYKRVYTYPTSEDPPGPGSDTK